MGDAAAWSDRSKAEQAYQSLRAGIQNGSYQPGERLVLGRLGAALGFSPVPVREALRRLEAEGFVDFVRNVGAKVAEIDSAAFEHSMEVLSVLESAAVVAATPRLRASDIQAARRLNERLRALLDDLEPVEFSVLNRQLHLRITSRCPNPRLTGLLEAEWTRLDTVRHSSFMFAPSRARHSVEEHDRFLDLLEGRSSPAALEHAVRQHRAATLEAVQTALARCRNRNRGCAA
ncbi:MAG: GntR family transcriptional regulator [Acidimicrobiales bacterium]